MVRAEWAIFEEDYWAINNVLEDLLKSSRSGYVMLIDRTGQLISQCGPDVDFDLTSFASLCAAEDVVALIRKEVEAVNKEFARVEQIKDFRLINVLLTAEDDELTATMKLKRSFVEKKHKALIDQMY